MGRRFILFSGEAYDRGEGGWRDYVEHYDSVDDAVKKAETGCFGDDQWAHVVDTESWDIVKSGDCSRKVPNDRKTLAWTWINK